MHNVVSDNPARSVTKLGLEDFGKLVADSGEAVMRN
jgi:hypothetical protein